MLFVVVCRPAGACKTRTELVWNGRSWVETSAFELATPSSVSMTIGMYSVNSIGEMITVRGIEGWTCRDLDVDLTLCPHEKYEERSSVASEDVPTDRRYWSR